MANKKLSQLSQLTSTTASENDRLLAYVPGELATVNQNKTISVLELRKKLNNSNGVVNVKDFGAVGDGVADDTVAIQAAVNVCAVTPKKTLVFPGGTYRITASIDIKNTGITLQGSGVQESGATISGNFNGFLIDASGTAPSTYYEPYAVENLKLINSNNGTSAGSAGCLDLRYTGRFVVRDCLIQAQNTPVIMAETIGAEFLNVFVIGDSGTNTTHTNSRGYLGFGRNCKIYGGRVYGCFIALDIAGDAWNINGLNCEFTDIIFRTSALSNMLVEGCHLETSGMVWTNAQTLPTITTSPWTDNGGDGTGWTGSVTFLNTHVAFGAVGTGNGVAAPIFVIKPQASFSGALNVIGCSLFVPNSLATISNSFNRAAATTLISGMKVVIAGNSNPLLDPATIPSDAYTIWSRFDSANGDGARFTRAKIDVLTGNINAQNAYQATGFTKLGLNDSSSYLDLSDGTAINGYTTVSLKSTFYGQGVRMLWNTFVPTVDNQCALGALSNRWTAVYAANGTIQTSDVNAKTDIQDTPLGLGFINSLTPRRFKMLESGNVTEGEVEDWVNEDGETLQRIKPGSQQPIPGQRYHEGLIAQEVKERLDALGLDSGMWVEGEDGKQGLRYEELIAPLIRAVQELTQEVEQLKAQLPAA